MKSTNETTAQLREFFENWQVLTDIEDRYVYSFKKIYSRGAISLPDIVVRIDQVGNSLKFSEWAKNQNITLISRNASNIKTCSENNKVKILIDDVIKPEINLRSEELRILRDSLIYKMNKNIQSTYNNISLALQLMLSESNLTKCMQNDICGGYCTITPFYKGIETWSAKGRFLLIRGLIKGDLELSQKIIDVIYACSKCGNCFSECFEQVDLHKAITCMRQIIAEKRLAPEVFHTIAENIKATGDPAGTSFEKRFAWLKNVPKRKLPDKPEILYWTGCMVSYRTPQTALAFYNLLKKLKADFTNLERNEGCCGYVLFSSGLWKEAEKVAQDVAKIIRKIGIKTLITPCSGCYYTFTKLYPEIANIHLPCEILHSSQFIEEKINHKQFDFNPINNKITYHDPCSLGRHCGVYDSPRNILKSIPNLKIIEMSLNKSQARCCGGGGGLWNYNHNISLDSASTRLNEDFIPLNIDILTTACPLCQMNFRITAKRNAVPLQVNDITEIIESALIMSPEKS